MKKYVIILSMVILSATSFAQEAHHIIDKYVKAIGGAEKWESLTSMKETIVFSQMGYDILGYAYKDVFNRESLHLEYNGASYIEAYDGETVWLLNGVPGQSQAEKLVGDKADALSKVHFVSEFIGYKANGHNVSLIGEVDFEGGQCFKIKFTRADGYETMHFFDKTTGLMTGETFKAGKRSFVMIYSNFEETGGVVVPMKEVQKEGDRVIYTKVTEELELNLQLDDALFVYPGK